MQDIDLARRGLEELKLECRHLQCDRILVAVDGDVGQCLSGIVLVVHIDMCYAEHLSVGVEHA